MAVTTQNAMKSYMYIGIKDSDHVPSHLHINQYGDNQPLQRGPRLTLGDASTLKKDGWVVVIRGTDPAIGECVQGEEHMSLGIFTPGLFQCMCIIVAVYANENDPTWSNVWLTHVSSDQGTDKIYPMIQKVNEQNHHRAYVAIGALKGSRPAMENVRNAFYGIPIPAKGPDRVLPELPKVYPPAHVWIYANENDTEKMGFGINTNGIVGQVTGVIG